MDVHSFRWNNPSHWLDYAAYLGGHGRQPDTQELFPRHYRVGSRACRGGHCLADYGAIATDRKEDPELDAQGLISLSFSAETSLNEIARSRSNGARMKIAMTSAFAVVLLGVTVLTVSSDTNSRPSANILPLIAPGVTNLFSTNAQGALKPQVYQASPYSCIVLVPKPIDTAALIAPPSTNQFAIRTMEPQLPLRLEPVK